MMGEAPSGFLFQGGHNHDTEPDQLVANDPDWIDRRALERAGWVLEDPDGLRGEPFERALHPECRPWLKTYPHQPAYPVWDSSRFPALYGEVVQIVYVPVGEATRTWANQVWSFNYPKLFKWFMNDQDLRAVRCHGVVFIKSDF